MLNHVVSNDLQLELLLRANEWINNIASMYWQLLMLLILCNDGNRKNCLSVNLYIFLVCIFVTVCCGSSLTFF